MEKDVVRFSRICPIFQKYFFILLSFQDGISGKFNTQLIDIWCQSFSYRSILSSITNDIACLERRNNSIDAHVECSPNRIVRDNEDLNIIMNKLKDENIFACDNFHVRKIMNGKIIHHKIIENITTMHHRGSERMNSFIQERYIDRSVRINDLLSAMTHLKLSNEFQEVEQRNLVKKQNNNDNSRMIPKIVKTADQMMKNVLSMSHFLVGIFSKRLKDLKPHIFSNEYMPLIRTSKADCI